MKAAVHRTSFTNVLLAPLFSSLFLLPVTGKGQSYNSIQIDSIYKSQMEYCASPDFTNSAFYEKCGTKRYSSSVSYKIKLNGLGKNIEMISDDACVGAVQITEDENEVYDCSYKQYKMESDKLNMVYTVYNLADGLTLHWKGKDFVFNLIDGGCDVHIKSLKHRFDKAGNTETMTIQVTKDMLLFENENPKSTYIVLKKGSEFKWTTTIR